MLRAKVFRSAPASPMSSSPPPLFDRRLHRLRLDRAAARATDADFLKRRAARDVAERLESVMREFPVAVDLGARRGAFAEALAESSAAGRVGRLIETDLSCAMLADREGPRLVADEEALPFQAESLDLVVSTLALHWVDDLPGALVQIRRALKPDGLFIGAFLGAGTLEELRWALLQAEIETEGGAGPRVSPFADGFDAAGLLQRAGFAMPVADRDTVTARYRSPLHLMRDLRAMGETNVLLERSPKPISRRALARACALYAERFGQADGRVPATFEIVTVTGWAPHESQPRPLKPGSATARLADVLGVKEIKP
jgi:SAM-dependent methyltransferase